MDKSTWERFHNALALAIMAHTGCTFSTQECNQLLEMMDDYLLLQQEAKEKDETIATLIQKLNEVVFELAKVMQENP